MNGASKANFYRQQSIAAANKAKDDWSLRGGAVDAQATLDRANQGNAQAAAHRAREAAERSAHPAGWYTRPYGAAWPNWQVCRDVKPAAVAPAVRSAALKSGAVVRSGPAVEVIAEGMTEKHARLFWTLTAGDLVFDDNALD